jgi:hypothetical protein
METQTAEDLVAGYALLTTTRGVAASPIDGEAFSITVTPISTLGCASAVRASVVTTVEAGC